MEKQTETKSGRTLPGNQDHAGNGGRTLAFGSGSARDARLIEAEQELISKAEELRRDIQSDLEKSNFFCAAVRKGRWQNFTEDAAKSKIEYHRIGPEQQVTEEIFGVEVHLVNLKSSALNSADICVEDYADMTEPERKDQINLVRHTLYEQLKWLWEQTFQNTFIKLCANRIVVRDNEKYIHMVPEQNEFVATPTFSRRVNFFGHVVHPYRSVKGRHGVKWTVSRKYRRAAVQQVMFHPETVEFLFQDNDRWAGEIQWRNLPNRMCAVDATLGFYRVMMRFAARPLCTGYGRVITITPPGLRGWLWYWIWRLLRVNP